MTDVILGDCVTVMAQMDAASFDAIVTDPPYGLEFMGKEWDRLGDVGQVSHAGPTERDGSTVFGRQRVAYNGSQNRRCRTCGHWAYSGTPCTCETPDFPSVKNAQSTLMQAWHEAWAREALRVAKPGAHLLAFGGTRTYHRLTCALEDAGWEIRDCLVYAYASGFPKSHNLDRLEAFCRCERAEVLSPQHDLRYVRQRDVPGTQGTSGGEGSVLFPSLSKPDVPATTDGSVEVALRASEPSVEGRSDLLQDPRQLRRCPVRQSARVGATDGSQGRVHHGAPAGHGASDGSAAEQDGSSEPPRPQSGEQRPGEPGALADERGSQTWRGWPVCGRCGKPQIPRGLGTALKPSWEPIVLARKPLSGTVAANVQRWGTGAINVDATRIGTGEGGSRDGEATASTRYGGNGIGFQPTPGVRGGDAAGRWPPNLLLTDAELFDVRNDGVVGSGASVQGGGNINGRPVTGYSKGWADERYFDGYGDTGGYARFFLVPKASRSDREPVWGEELDVNPAGSLNMRTDSHSVRNGMNTAPRRNTHPTTKPVALMRHLVRLVTPPGGRILDPFLGSGTTAIAAIMEGFTCVGIEKEPEYVAIANARLNGVQTGIGL